MKRFILILTAVVLAMTFCACSLVEPNPNEVIEDAIDDSITVDDPVIEEEEKVEDVFEEEEEVFDGICPFTENIVDPDNVSENAIYIETAKIPEGATEHILDRLSGFTTGLIVDLGFSEEVANGMSVATGFVYFDGSTGEYGDIYYFPAMYGDEAVALVISSYNEDNERYNFQFGGNTICDVMNCLETSPENPAVFVYFEGISGGYFITTTSAYKLVADENGSYEIEEEDISDSVREIMNREVNPDNVIAVYGATVD